MRFVKAEDVVSPYGTDALGLWACQSCPTLSAECYLGVDKEYAGAPGWVSDKLARDLQAWVAYIADRLLTFPFGL